MRFTCLFCSLILGSSLLLAPPPIYAKASGDVGIVVSVRVAPPILPVYVQPICPGPGYIWVPGYWLYGDDGYFWVPGTWILPPEVGFLWTPGYWGFDEGFYVWHAGYWGPTVGFYGGIDYGFGYPGVGFFGGYWQGGEYFYNRSVTNVNTTVIHNVYNTTVINQNSTSRVSFNGGNGGTRARPTPAEIAAQQQRHVGITPEQNQHLQAAATNRTLLASVNHGRPDVAATTRAGEFNNRANARTVSPGAPPTANAPRNAPPNANRPENAPSTEKPHAAPPRATPPKANRADRPPTADRPYAAQPRPVPPTANRPPRASTPEQPRTMEQPHTAPQRPALERRPATVPDQPSTPRQPDRPPAQLSTSHASSERPATIPHASHPPAPEKSNNAASRPLPYTPKARTSPPSRPAPPSHQPQPQAQHAPRPEPQQHTAAPRQEQPRGNERPEKP